MPDIFSSSIRQPLFCASTIAVISVISMWMTANQPLSLRVETIGFGWTIRVGRGHILTTVGVLRAPWSCSGVQEQMSTAVMVTHTAAWVTMLEEILSVLPKSLGNQQPSPSADAPITSGSRQRNRIVTHLPSFYTNSMFGKAKDAEQRS